MRAATMCGVFVLLGCVFCWSDVGETAEPTEIEFIRGDCNDDEEVTFNDAVFLLQYLFNEGAVPTCLVACDVNDSGSVPSIADSTALLAYLFVEGPAPAAPYPEPGTDTTYEFGDPQCLDFEFFLSVRTDFDENPTRSLDAYTVEGEVFITLEPTNGVETVTFYLDDPERKNDPHRVEASAPFDFTSGAIPTGPYTADNLPWDPTTVADGDHTVTAEVELANGEQRVVQADFVVSNPKLLIFSEKNVEFRHRLHAPKSEQSRVKLLLTDSTSDSFTLDVEEVDWLTVNKTEKGVPSALEVVVDSTDLELGVYTASMSASVEGYDDAETTITLKVLTSTHTDLVDSVTRHDITWNFDDTYEVGQFANGDYFVIGPVTITESAPSWNGTLDGSMINPEYGERQGYDSRFKFSESLRVETEDLTLEPGQSLVTVDSWREDDKGVPAINKSTDIPRPALKTAAVLTCLDEVPPEGTFRPPYGGSDKPLFNVEDIQWELLPGLERPKNTPKLSVMEPEFEKLWLDHISKWQNRYMHPSENMPDYSRDLARAFNTGSLMLMLDYSDDDKETLLIRLLQIGIDQFAILKSGATWGDGGGGIGSGRKWPILLAGVLLDDEEMMNIGKDYDPDTALEDCQTFYIRSTDLDEYPDHEIGEPAWGERHCTGYPGKFSDPGNTGYRVCCTGNAWVGAVLSARILTGETDIDVVDLWDHPPLFDYQDKHMAAHESGHWHRSLSGFQNDMWDEYRDDYGEVWSEDDD